MDQIVKDPAGGARLRRRNKADPNVTVVGVRLPASMARRIDGIRRVHPELPTRSAVIRELVIEALDRRSADG